MGTNLKNPDFAEVARSMGALGVRAERAEDIAPGLKSLIESGKPGVLAVTVSDELGDPFRRDALKKPQRTMQKYKKFE